MRTNKYKGRCGECGLTVPARGGRLERRAGSWVVHHLACAEAENNRQGPLSKRSPAVMSIVIGGNHYIRNSRGRCIDAPCCGCCTI